jgi:hypothetical protein
MGFCPAEDALKRLVTRINAGSTGKYGQVSRFIFHNREKSFDFLPPAL